ncbi:MAG TPA: adenosine deaminase, partial [Ruminiclostridium sp.]|nr:adenosine deaminase [Ruminiclostridium sp.]
MSFIDDMPKVDLHNHLDGGLRPETVTDIAQKEGIALPTYDVREIRSYLTVEDNCGSLVEYLEKFDLPLLCLQSEYAQRRVAKEAVEDAAKQNVKYIEVRFAPQLMVERGLSCSNVIKNVIDGLKDGEKETGTVAGAIVCCMRHHTKEQNLEAIRAAAEFLNRGLAGVDLAGDEFHFPPQ